MEYQLNPIVGDGIMKIAFSLHDISIIWQARNLFISYSNKSINWVVILIG